MTCERYREAIDGLVDGTLSAADQAELQRHLDACPSCRVLAADLARIRHAAAALPKETPPDRVWARIAAALEERQTMRQQWFVRSRVWALSAAAVVLLAAGVSLLVWRGMPRADVRAPGAADATAAPSPTAAAHGSGGELVQSVESELRQAEQHYEKAIAGLEQIAKAGQGALDPQVAATLQKNLGVIDQAIRESQVALQSQPTSELAQESLFEAFRRKVALLQDTITLINEMRKGDQAGTAKIIGNLNNKS